MARGTQGHSVIPGVLATFFAWDDAMCVETGEIAFMADEALAVEALATCL
jgi:hypothetical protein